MLISYKQFQFKKKFHFLVNFFMFHNIYFYLIFLQYLFENRKFDSLQLDKNKQLLRPLLKKTSSVNHVSSYKLKLRSKTAQDEIFTILVCFNALAFLSVPVWSHQEMDDQCYNETGCGLSTEFEKTLLSLAQTVF